MSETSDREGKHEFSPSSCVETSPPQKDSERSSKPLRCKVMTSPWIGGPWVFSPLGSVPDMAAYDAGAVYGSLASAAHTHTTVRQTNLQEEAG